MCLIESAVTTVSLIRERRLVEQGLIALLQLEIEVSVVEIRGHEGCLAQQMRQLLFVLVWILTHILYNLSTVHFTNLAETAIGTLSHVR